MSELSSTVSLGTYLGKAVLALIVITVSGWVFLHVAKRKGWLQKGSDKLYIISSLSLGRDVFFVIRCGPEVIAVVTGSSGARLMGRWNLEDWNVPEREREKDGS